jgi:hypothetical protein
MVETDVTLTAEEVRALAEALDTDYPPHLWTIDHWSCHFEATDVETQESADAERDRKARALLTKLGLPIREPDAFDD